MGPGLALATLGAQAAAPVALIFCFETLLFFSLVPLLMAIARPGAPSLAGALRSKSCARSLLHPLVIATALGVLSAALPISSRRSRSTAAAVPAKRRGAVRAVHARA